MDILSIVLGALIGWLTAHVYYRKASREMSQELNRLSSQLRDRNTPEDFQHQLQRSQWTKSFIKDVETWTADNNAMFQIEIGHDSRPFSERWTRGFPDPNSSCYTVYLKINRVPFRELPFVALDGARINVPVPKCIPVAEDVVYVWDPNDISFLVGKVIGTYYIHNGIEQLAKRCGVEIPRESVIARATK